MVFMWTVGGFGPFWAVGGGGGVGCVQGRGLGDRARRAPLAFRDLSYWEASVTLYLWFRFQTFVATFGVLKRLKLTANILERSQLTPSRYLLALIRLRSSHLRCSTKKVVRKNFAIFTGKHLCWSLFLIKLQDFRPATLLERNSNTGVFL